MTLYFAHHQRGGPIKIGVARDAARRVRHLTDGGPEPLELLAAIPGERVRESALKWVCRHHVYRGEWLFSGLPVWRLVVEAADHGDLPWLPDENPGDMLQRDAVARAARVLACSSTEAAVRLGYAGASFVTRCSGRQPVSLIFLGRVLAEEARVSGAVPAYLAPF